MYPQLRLSQSSVEYSDVRGSAPPKKLFDLFVDSPAPALNGIRRRWARERRRRKVGRAYDMALEIARVVHRSSQVLDVGCGNGYIAHHLSAMLGTSVIGIDVTDTTDAPIDYRQFNGRDFPLPDDSCDAVVLAYVLHHAQDVYAVLSEIKRVLRPGGLAMIYEDIPETPWDRFICWTHDLQWRGRTGACTFRSEAEWRRVFQAMGFFVVRNRQLARLRNLMHPVCRRSFVLRDLPPLAIRITVPQIQIKSLGLKAS
jgi:SAM-dependent methyltransferase